ncbi:MAG: prenyltransferase/squalene oxidase repeat-containing protein [Pirellulaceae bacterium]
MSQSKVPANARPKQKKSSNPNPRARQPQKAAAVSELQAVALASQTKAPPTAGEQLAEKEEARRKAPSWLVSLIFHLAMLLVLALIPLNEIIQGPLTLVFGDSGSEGITEFELKGAEDSSEMLEVEDANLESAVNAFESLQSIELPDFSPNISDAIASNVAPESIPFGIRQGLSGRQGPLKSALLAKFGGNSETEAAVELGLKWLVKQQKSNGSWSLTGPYANGSSVENTTAATAMAINAFLGAGYTHKQGKYRQNVDLGIKYLVRRQNSEGFFSKREPSRQQMYAQAIASIAIIEAFGMTNDPELRGPAMLAVSFAEWSQSSLKGWRYNPREDADVSVTGWFVMAMETAKMSGLPVNAKKLNSVNDFLDSVAYEEQARYAYNRFEPPSLSMTAEALLCRIYLGWPRTHPSLLAAIHDDLLPARPGLGDDEYSVYYWYYATQVLHHVGGGVWDQWNKAMKKTIPVMQEKTGPEAGSWDPGKDVFGASGGRLYTTCLSIYCLEVYYRHLALYDLK